MSLSAPSPSTPMSESTFYMLRCVVAVACADNVIKQEELLLMRALLSHFKRHMYVSPEQIARLKDDLKDRQSIDALLPHVTDRSDREQLILFAGLLAQTDGDVAPAEEELLRKIQSWCAPRPGEPPSAPAAVPAGIVHPPSQPAQSPLTPAGAAAAATFDMHGFMEEVRDVVKQEVYKESLKTSGVTRGTRAVAVVDAFAEKSPIVPHKESYDIVAEEAKLSRDMQHSLVPNERLLATGHFHWMYGVYTVAGTVLLAVGANWVHRHMAETVTKARDYLTSGRLDWVGTENIPKYYALLQNPLTVEGPKYFLLGAALLFFVWRMAVWYTTEIIVTDSRVVVRRGIFWIKTFKCDLTQLGQVDVDQSLLGKILGYGKIHIFTRNFSGKGNAMEVEGIDLPVLADPHSFSTQVDRARRMWRTRSV